MVPTQHPGLLASAYGLLVNELHRAPDNVLVPVQQLLTGALALDTGAVCDLGGEDFNTGVDIILYVTRLACRVDNYVSFLMDHTLGKHRCVDAPLREVKIPPSTLATLAAGRRALRLLLEGVVAPLLEEYLHKLDKETRNSPSNEKLIDRNSRLACDLHAHKLLLYRNSHQEELTPGSAKTLVGSFVYLTTRHTWNKAARRQGRLLVPETEMYELLTVTRRRLITWKALERQGVADSVLQTALQVASSTTGSLRASASLVDAANRWSTISGPHSVGRFAVASTRTVKEAEEGKAVQAGADAGPLEVKGADYNDLVDSVADTGLLGVEMDLMIAQMTLRSKHLQALESNVANHPGMCRVQGKKRGEGGGSCSLLFLSRHPRVPCCVGTVSPLDLQLCAPLQNLGGLDVGVFVCVRVALFSSRREAHFRGQHDAGEPVGARREADPLPVGGARARARVLARGARRPPATRRPPRGEAQAQAGSKRENMAR